MTQKVLYEYAVNFNADTDVLISGVSGTNISEGSQIQRPMYDGEEQPRVAHVSSYDQGIDFVTSQIKTFLDLVANSTDVCAGKAISGTDTFDLYSQLVTSGGSRETGSSHQKYVVNSGLLVPTSLSCGNDQAGSVSCMIYPVSDGTNNPVVYSGSSALVGTPAPTTQYYSGPVLLNNTALDGVQSISINFGLDVRKMREKGLADATLCYIHFKSPSITVTTTNIDLAATYNRGVAISSSTKAFLRAGTANGSRVAEGTDAHLSFTASQGMIQSRAISGSPQTMAIDILPTFDDSNAILIYDTEAIS